MTGETFIGDRTAPSAGPFDPSEVLTTLEVAQRLKLKTAKAIRGAIRRGELAASLVGGEFRILGEDANSYWQRQRTDSSSPTAAAIPATSAAGTTVRRSRRQPILGQAR